MTELINIENVETVTEDQFLEVIFKAIDAERYEIAADLMTYLNSKRIEAGAMPYAVADVLLMYSSSRDMFRSYSKNNATASVYVGEFSDGIVKIGVSKQPVSRLKTLEKQRGFKLRKWIFTKVITDAFAMERELHIAFKEQRIEGEYFQLRFDDVLPTFESIYKKYAEAAI